MTGLDANNESLYDKFEKKIVKIYRAMRVMEQAKHTEPRFSDAFKDLARFLNDTKKSMGGDTMSRFSSVGETFKVKGDADSLSNFGGISTVFGNFALINSSCQGVQVLRNSSVFSEVNKNGNQQTAANEFGFNQASTRQIQTREGGARPKMHKLLTPTMEHAKIQNQEISPTPPKPDMSSQKEGPNHFRELREAKEEHEES